MNVNWEEYRLDEVCSKVTDGTHDTPKTIDKGIPLIKGKDISNGFIDFENCDQISTDDHKEIIKRSHPEYGDILFSNIGNSIGDCVRINTRREFSIKNVALFKPNQNIVDARFLYYTIKSEKFYREIWNMVSGAAQPFASLTLLRGHKIQLPPLTTQRKIASILSAYDDLIENNLKRIKLLEEKAQLTYEEWFVRMKFPGHETTPINEETGLPEGWEKVKLKEISRFQMGYTFKSNDFNSDMIGKKIIRIRNIPSSSSSDYTTEIVDEKYLVQKGDLLVGMDGEFYINNWYDDVAYLVQRVCNIQPHERSQLAFITESIRTPIAILQNSIDGATVAHLGKKHLDTIEILLPKDDDIFDFFQDLLYAKINISRQNQLLKEARDLLLPRLMSGMIDVQELDVKLEEIETK